MKRMELRDRWILVTGASSGLGREMARQLAVEHGAKPILVARRAQRLEELAAELRERGGVECAVIAADLSDIADVDRAFREATEGREVHAAVLNAGITYFGLHMEQDWDSLHTLISTNAVGTVRLARHLLPHLIESNGGGGIMFINSLSALVPVPYQTAYSATKAFLLAYAQGLSHEHARDNISITSFAAGGIDTEMSAAHDFKERVGDWQVHPVDRVARAAISAMAGRHYIYIPGLMNRAQTFLTRFTSRRLNSAFIGNFYRRLLPKG